MKTNVAEDNPKGNFVKNIVIFYPLRTQVCLVTWKYIDMSNLLTSTIDEEVTTGSHWGYFVWNFIPGRSYQGQQAPPANDWTLVNFSRIWWSLGIAARWMWLMQQMNPIPKINGAYHKMLGGRASTEPANGQGQLVQSANYCNHL